MKDTLNFILAGSEVKRYHTVTTLMTETVGHHSHGVAMLILLMNPDASADVISFALMHDLAECETGDIPSPAKKRFGINEQISIDEKKIMLSHGLKLPYLSREERRLLKLADIAQGALFCLREMELGNSKIRLVFDRYIEYSEALKPVGEEKTLFNIIKEKANECE